MLLKIILLLCFFSFHITRTENFYKECSEEKTFKIVGFFDERLFTFTEVFRYYIANANKNHDIFSFCLYLIPNKDHNYILTNSTLDLVLGDKSLNPCLNKQSLPRLIGIVGLSSSKRTEYVSNILTYLNIPILSYYAVSDTLSDKKLHPNVYRTIPAAHTGFYLIDVLLKKYNWTYVSVLYQNDAYGKSGPNALKNLGICLANELMINSTNIIDSLNLLFNDKKSNVYIVHTFRNLKEAYLKLFIKEITVMKKKYGY